MLLLSVTARAWNGPRDWPVEDEADERLVRRALAGLGAFAVDHEDAVLLAVGDEGSLGSWSLSGARQLARELDSARSPGLQPVRRELRDALSAG